MTRKTYDILFQANYPDSKNLRSLVTIEDVERMEVEDDEADTISYHIQKNA